MSTSENGLTITAIRVSPSAARNVVTTAIEAGHTHGIGYWAEVRNVRENDKREIIAFDVRGHGGKDEPKRWKKIKAEDVEAAVQKMLVDGGEATHCRGLLKQLIEFDVDGPLADAIVQVMAMGDVVYG